MVHRISNELSQSRDFRFIPEWLERHTHNPKKDNKPWSFEGHEFQKEILTDDSRSIKGRKCSQVGMSELTLRLALATMQVFSPMTVIYTLPTTMFARKFSQTRIWPVIKNSEFLKSQVSRDHNSAQMREIGNSFLYVNGCMSKNDAISVPADMLIHDEEDFSSPDVLALYSSRLGHAEGGGYRRSFSTPTVHGFGVSKDFDLTTKAHYAVNCDSCKKWVMPDPLEDIVVADDLLLKDCDREILFRIGDRVQDSFLKCPECQHKFTAENLINQEKRKWIRMNPEATVSGYQIYPYDVPTINTIPDIVSEMQNFRKSDFVNMRLGLPYEDESNSIQERSLDNAKVVPAIDITREQSGVPLAIGIDVGKTLHMTIVRVDPLEIVWYGTFRQNGENYALDFIRETYKRLKARGLVIDAYPDFTLSKQVVTALPYSKAFASEYVRGLNNPLETISLRKDDGVVKIDRSKAISEMVAMINEGKIPICRISKEYAVFKTHLRAMKKVRRGDDSGSSSDSWVNTGPDHYAHSTLYALAAANICKGQYTHDVPISPIITPIRLK
jgi:hypothetical protein